MWENVKTNYLLKNENKFRFYDNKNKQKQNIKYEKVCYVVTINLYL